ncbi:hypothetical protein HHI36_013988 [Cryptolaemus montrouzieri]|uniref:Uncharacterized protein n=1 Tax=Cryptolaemus montrouzieri TaxID=559131 RepID=A0ABD2N222_9CUCU
MEEPVFEKRRLFSEAKMQHFRECLGQCSWEVVLREADMNRAYDAFNGVIRSRMDLIFPEKTRAKKSSVTVAWITKGIRVSCKNKRVLYKGVRSGWVSEEYYKKYVKVSKQAGGATKYRQIYYAVG